MRRTAAWTVVAEADGKVVGFSDLTSDGVLDMLFVHPDFGNHGVGRQLVESVLTGARQRGLSAVATPPVGLPDRCSNGWVLWWMRKTMRTGSGVCGSRTTTCTLISEGAGLFTILGSRSGPYFVRSGCFAPIGVGRFRQRSSAVLSVQRAVFVQWGQVVVRGKPYNQCQTN